MNKCTKYGREIDNDERILSCPEKEECAANKLECPHVWAWNCREKCKEWVEKNESMLRKEGLIE